MPILTITYPGKPPLIPPIQVPFYTARLEEGMAEKLEAIVLKEKDHILANTELPKGMPPTWLTGRFWFYNLLDYDYKELQYLKKFITEEYTNYLKALGQEPSECYIRVWANVLKFKQEITWHNHYDCVTGTTLEESPFPHVSGNICVKTFDTKTWFKSPFIGGAGTGGFGKGTRYKQDVIGVDNVINECLFFPSWVPHRTDENMYPESRITISFDIIPAEVYHAKENNTIFRKLI